jgi:predicted Zn-dependent protease
VLAGRHFDDDAYERDLVEASAELELFSRPERKLPRGNHRVYLAPAAVGELLRMFSWKCIGESYLRQGESPMLRLREGEDRLSPMVTLWEDFSSGDLPRFNSFGELAPERLCVIERGALKHTLVNARSAREYGVPSTGANVLESMQAPSLEPGSLPSAQALSALGEGLYISNLHYLNWSQRRAARVTGMTRHACFWVEGGKKVAPIEDMRWDDSIFRILGSELQALTAQAELVAEPKSYLQRELGRTLAPGALIRNFSFTI